MSGYGNSRQARRTKPMSKATQCAEALVKNHFVDWVGTEGSLINSLSEVIRRFYPEEQGLNMKDYCIICNHSIDDCHSFALNYPNKWMESHTVSHPGCTYQKDTETNSLRMIDEGRDV